MKTMLHLALWILPLSPSVAGGPLYADPTPKKTTPKKAPVAPVSSNPKPPVAVKLTPLQGKPGFIRGRAVFASGKPVPNFLAYALGWAGELHLGPTGTIPDLGEVKGMNGRYEFRPTSAFDRQKILSEALVPVVRAEAHLSYKDRKYKLAMYPLDGLRDGDGKDGFRGYVSKGVVRDFMLKLHGPKIGFEKNTPPRDTNSDEPSDPSYAAFYGGMVAFHFRPAEGENPDPGPFKDSILTLSFTPDGTLLDGSTSRPFVRTLRIQEESVVKWFYGYFRDIPLGDYTLTATLTKPNRDSYPLRLKQLGLDYQSSFPVQFTPWDTLKHVKTVEIYASRGATGGGATGGGVTGGGVTGGGGGNQDLSIQTGKTVFAAGERITGRYSGLPGNNQDWVAIVKAGSPNGSYLIDYYFYTQGKKEGTFDFKPLPPGEYEARVYVNWGAGDNAPKAHYSFTIK